ncbi:hypothetical protein Asppvi_001557 [Aspergillus pseudoviridinutans]|uniref:Uncharacterized protein n=1 Tax=Aspergillus pseudoviridinutans TaxID=1517512 RepID=A0A9P3B5F1_9EURO|nr:uncharacterized protein Asppvi_001557 [Aspergillus pseudoviridinutans]GIJ83040.1 hypothetical protein Asppvi_001557 [Aspergillus pseudoviridinutans]
MTYRDAKDWTNFFFSQSPPDLTKLDLETQVDFKRFRPASSLTTLNMTPSSSSNVFQTYAIGVQRSL